MDKDVLHTYSGILLSHKRNKTEPSVVIVIRLVFVIQSDVSQEEKSTYHILMHVYVI